MQEINQQEVFMHQLLFTSKKINQLAFKNRYIMSAMHLGYCDENGCITDKDIAFYKARAKGGISAATLVAAINKAGGPLDMHRLYDNAALKSIHLLSSILHEYNCKLIVQLFHCGRNGTLESLGGQTPLAPSAVASPIYRTMPKEMSSEDIQNTINDFAESALRCKENGIDAIEVSCSAGYLLSQFLSPLTNLREDRYGKSDEKRMKFPLEVLNAIRYIVGPNYPVILRVSGSDMLQNGYSVEYMKNFSKAAELYVDCINVTGGWHESPVPQISYHVPKGCFSFLAQAVKSVVSIPVIASNRLNDPNIAEEILEKDFADFIGIARCLLTDPEYVDKIKNGKSIRPCQACNKGCIERILRYKEVKCAFNPETGRENNPIAKSKNAKNILVIGGGPGGLEAARLASKSGHLVLLCTNCNSLGGQVIAASRPPHKSHFMDYIHYMEKELRTLNVTIHLNTDVTDQYIKKINPDFVIVATGSKPIIPPIEGVERPNVFTAEEVLLSDSNIMKTFINKKNIIIGGGAVGLETAHFLVSKLFIDEKQMSFLLQYASDHHQSMISPVDITIIEIMSKVGNGLGGLKHILLKELKQNNVKMITDTKVLSIHDNYVAIKKSTETRKVPCDNVILAIGYKPQNNALLQNLKESAIPYSVIGDAVKSRSIMDALTEAYKTIKNI